MSRRSVIAVLAGAALVAGTAGAVQAQGKGDANAGKAVYGANKCVNCHGEHGAGDGPQGQKLKDKPSNWTAGAGLKGMEDQQLFDSIKKGGGAVGKSKAMPAYGKLSDDDVWNLVAYVKSLKK